MAGTLTAKNEKTKKITVKYEKKPLSTEKSI